jgi:hypothetical protein
MLSPPSRPRSRWWSLLRPAWLAWHAFAVLAAAGMLWLGDWQLHRAEAGNDLSWAYTFEWPLFAVLGAVFWCKTVRAELRAPGADGPSADDQGGGEHGAAGQGAGDDRAGDGAATTAGAGSAAYAARLRTEIRGHGRWHGLR